MTYNDAYILSKTGLSNSISERQGIMEDFVEWYNGYQDPDFKLIDIVDP